MNKRTRDRVIEVSAEIQGLRDRLKILEGQLDGLLRGEDASPGDPDQSREPRPGTLGQEIKSFIDEHPGQEFTADDLYARHPNTSIQTVRTTLARLRKMGLISHASRGKYCAISESDELFPGNNPTEAAAAE